MTWWTSQNVKLSDNWNVLLPACPASNILKAFDARTSCYCGSCRTHDYFCQPPTQIGWLWWEHQFGWGGEKRISIGWILSICEEYYNSARHDYHLKLALLLLRGIDVTFATGSPAPGPPNHLWNFIARIGIDGEQQIMSKELFANEDRT